MGKHKSERFKIRIVKKISQGIAVKDIVLEYGIPESTVYKWLSEYSEYKTHYGSFTLKQFRALERQNEDLRLMLNLAVNSPFIHDVPQQDREAYMEKVQEITELKPHILCGAFGIDHATYHHYLYDNKRDEAWFVARHNRLVKLIRKIYAESDGVFGAKRIRYVLKYKYHMKEISEEYVRKIMRENGLKGATPKRIKRKQNAEYKVFLHKENLLNQDFFTTMPNTKWVLDCKLFYCKRKQCQLCAVEDLFARKVIAYKIGRSENGRLIKATLTEAFVNRKTDDRLIIHSDRGGANQSERVNSFIRQHKARHSYSETADPFDGAPIESFFSHFSTEFLVDVTERHPFNSMRDMEERVAKYIGWYNETRPHIYNDGKSPNQKEREWKRDKNM